VSATSVVAPLPRSKRQISVRTPVLDAEISAWSASSKTAS
jgi:hypothetical protein